MPLRRALALFQALAAGLALLCTPAAASDARFRITGEVVNPDLPPFAVTISAFGNGAGFLRRNTGFEPTVHRTWFETTRAAENRLHGDDSRINVYNTFAPGALDGAAVEILRRDAEGRLARIRQDRVAEGGHRGGGWRPMLRPRQAIPGEARRHTYTWNRWNRPGVPYWFTLRAVDAEGRMSPRSEPLVVTAPDPLPRLRGKRRKAVRDPLVRLDRRPRGGGTLAAPTGLRGEVTREGALDLSWSAAPGAEGFVLERSSLDPADHGPAVLGLAGSGPAIEKGDIVFVSKTFTESAREGVFSARVWNGGRPRQYRPKVLDVFSDELPDVSWRLRPHDPGTPVAAPGSTYLSIDIDTDRRFSIGTGVHASARQSWYAVLQPGTTYRIEAWMRADRPTRARFDLQGVPGVALDPFDVGREWRRYVAEVQPIRPYTAKPIRQLRLEMTGPGRIDIDNFRMYEADRPFLAPTDGDIARLRASGMGALRTHALVKTGTATYDLEQLTNLSGAASAVQNTLPGHLELIRAAGMTPWLQIEPHLSAEEWQGLVEYLAAPAGSGYWADKRAAQGQVAPWTEVFERLYLEIGNETWNRNFQPWVFSGQSDIYGAYHEYAVRAMRDSPWWPGDDRIEGVIGGFIPVEKFGRLAAANAPSARHVVVNAYIGGWESRSDPPTGTRDNFETVLAHALRVNGQFARRHVGPLAQLPSDPSPGVYEGGPGYLHPRGRIKLDEAQLAIQERVMKSNVSGTATLDQFLDRTTIGFRLQGFFAFGSGTLWKSHNPNGLPTPAWLWLSLFNEHAAGGDLLAVETLAAPRRDLEPYRKLDPVPGAPMVAAYAVRRDDRVATFLVNRTLEPQEVTVDLPGPASRLRRISLTGAFDAHNVEGEAVRAVSETAPGAAAIRTTLAPGMAELWVAEGVASH